MQVFLLASLLFAFCSSQALDFAAADSRDPDSPFWLPEETYSVDITGRDDLADSVVEFYLQAVQFGYPCYYSVWIDTAKVSNGAFTNVAANVIPLALGTFHTGASEFSIRTMNCWLGRYAVPFLFNSTTSLATAASSSVYLVDILTPNSVPDLTTNSGGMSTAFPDTFFEASAKLAQLTRQDGNCMFSSQACFGDSFLQAVDLTLLVDFSDITDATTNGFVLEISGWNAGTTWWNYLLCNSTAGSCATNADFGIYNAEFVDHHTAYTDSSFLGTGGLTAVGVDEPKFFRTFMHFPTDTDYVRSVVLDLYDCWAVFFPYVKVWNLDVQDDPLHQLVRISTTNAGSQCRQVYSGSESTTSTIDVALGVGIPQFGFNPDSGALFEVFASNFLHSRPGTPIPQATPSWFCATATVTNVLYGGSAACTSIQNNTQIDVGTLVQAQTANINLSPAMNTGFAIQYGYDAGLPATTCSTPATVTSLASALLTNYEILVGGTVAASFASHSAKALAEWSYSSGIGSVVGFNIGEDISTGFTVQIRALPGYSMLFSQFFTVHALPDPVCNSATDCNGHGSCRDKTTAVCACDLGWTGDDCGTPVRYCQPGLCMNGGECSENPARTEDPNFPGQLSQAILCNCANTAGAVSGDPFQGDFCEIVPPCEIKPCLNGGVCSPNGTNSYSCDCSGTTSPSSTNPYSGRHCEVPNTDPCELAPCLNGATCTDGPAGSNTYTCNCANGWLGTNCEIPPINNCATNNPCGTHGVCIADASATSRAGAFVRCVCTDGWGGDTCTQEPPACTGKCQNDGICIHDALRLGQGADSEVFACICKAPWVGAWCHLNSTMWGAAPGMSAGIIPLLVALFALLF